MKDLENIENDAARRPGEVDLARLSELLPQAGDKDYWRRLSPSLAISDDPFAARESASSTVPAEIEDWLDQLREEGYFQTGPLIPETLRRDMLEAIANVRQAGFPPLFSLVYDVFHEALLSVHHVLRALLGEGYRMVPNYWIYYLEARDTDYGYEPHRDAEYTGTVGADGLPTVVNAWFALTDATPLNGCMYLIPASRDPGYDAALRAETTSDKALRAPEDVAFQNIRAIPAAAGTVSIWDQYVFHWGSRSSRRAAGPRISMATYFERGDLPSVDPAAIDLSKPLPFERRLGLIARAMTRYSSAWGVDRTELPQPFNEFTDRYTELLVEPERA